MLQMKQLRVLQEGEARRVGDTRLRRVDVRIVSATHRTLDQAVAAGTFRADLLFRLNAVTVRLPPLRERGRDVLLMARHFLGRAAAREGRAAPVPTPALHDRLLRHPWPGNVRELSNACAYAVHVGGARDRVDLEHWPESPAVPVPSGARPALGGAGLVTNGLHAETRALEERRLRETLERTRWNKSQAARVLGLSRQGLLKKLRRYGLGHEVATVMALDAPTHDP